MAEEKKSPASPCCSKLPQVKDQDAESAVLSSEDSVQPGSPRDGEQDCNKDKPQKDPCIYLGFWNVIDMVRLRRDIDLSKLNTFQRDKKGKLIDTKETADVHYDRFAEASLAKTKQLADLRQKEGRIKNELKAIEQEILAAKSKAKALKVELKSIQQSYKNVNSDFSMVHRSNSLRVACPYSILSKI